MRIILLGPPGLGKGTQASLLQQRFAAVHISSGSILRTAVERETPAGLAAQPFMHKGDLVPDSIMIAILGEVLRTPAVAGGFILDGFPRTGEQAAALDSLLGQLRLGLDAVILLTGELSEVQARIAGRRVCHDCGRTFNLAPEERRHDRRCEVCGGQLYQRDDDKEDTVRHRYEVYHRQTEPLIDFYRAKGLLRVVDGMPDVETVFGGIAAALPEGVVGRTTQARGLRS